MYTRSASFRQNAGSEPVFGGGRAFGRNTVTSPRKPAACRPLAARLALPRPTPSGKCRAQARGACPARLVEPAQERQRLLAPLAPTVQARHAKRPALGREAVRREPAVRLVRFQAPLGSEEANLVRLAALTSAALDALAQVHLPQYRREVAQRSSG